MITAHFADPHARGKDLPAFSAQWNAAIDICISEHVDAVLIAGDVFDKYSHGDRYATTDDVQVAVVEPLMRLQKHNPGCRVIVVPGDHDLQGPGHKNALAILRTVPGCTVVDYPQRIDLACATPGGEGIVVVAVPWQWSPDANAERDIMDNVVSNFGAPERQVLLSHLEVDGLKMTSNQVAEPKQSTDARQFSVRRKFLDDLNVGHLALGNYHIRGNGMIGALRQLNFGECGNPAGFEIRNWTTGETEWHELDAAPRYWQKTVTSDAQLQELLAERRDLFDHYWITADGFIPDPNQYARADKLGIRLDHWKPREERKRRVQELPDSILGDSNRADLINTWAKTQDPVIDDAETDRLIKLYNDTRQEVAP